jgi:hypothetical protein
VTLPDAVELGAGFTATVEVQVEIPAGTLSDTVDTTVVTATSEINDAIFDTAVDTTAVGLACDVLLEPYHASWVDSDPWQPVQVVYTHRLTNTGNYTDTFGLVWESSQGLAVVVAPTGATLGGGAGTTVYVTVTVPAIPADTVLVDTTVVTAASQSVITVTDPATDTTYVNLQLGVELAPDREGSDIPGNTVYYTHILTNNGNYTDTFIFEAQSSPTVQVGVQIPGGTLSNTVDTTVVTATSWFSTAVSASVVDTTIVEQAPGVSLKPEWPDAEGWCVQSPPSTFSPRPAPRWTISSPCPTGATIPTLLTSPRRAATVGMSWSSQSLRCWLLTLPLSSGFRSRCPARLPNSWTPSPSLPPPGQTVLSQTVPTT